MLTKLLFPFRRRRTFLRRYWWHRLAVVLFFLLVSAVLFGVWIGSNQRELAAYGNCVEINLSVNRPSGEGCDVFLPHSRDNFIAGMIATLAANYLLQLIYYRVILYVAMGSRTDADVAGGRTV